MRATAGKSLQLLQRVRGLASAPATGDGVMVALAVAVGLTTGLLAAALIEVVAGVQSASFGPLPDPWAVLVIPATGGLLVGIFVTYVVPEARGGGVSQLMMAIALHGGRMRPIVAPGKLLASGVAIGTGSSGGREGPIVQIGGAVGSTIGRLFALSEEQARALIAAGAGGGIAASFNAPIGGMLFALEVIIGGFRARYLQVIVVASVVASVTAREIIGPGIIYNPPPYRLGDPRELVLYALLGLGAAGIGIALARSEFLVARLSGKLRVWPPLRTALGGLGVGLIALWLPEVLGTGDHLPAVQGAVTEPIATMLAGELGGTGLSAAGFLLLLLGAKLVATAVSIGTGSSVGSFAPSIFLGAALGGALGHATQGLLADAAVEPGALAVVGMAAVVGASARAPLTGIIIAFELTGDYGLVLPLMMATGIAIIVAERADRASVYTLPLLRRGIVYAEPEDIDIMQTVRVGEIMTKRPDTVPADLPLQELHAAFRRTGHHGFPVVEGDPARPRLVGIVTIGDLGRATGTAEGAMTETGDLSAARDLTVGDICTRRPLTVTARDPVFRALRRMAALDVGRLPVVAPDDHSRLVGLVRRADIVKAYQRAVSRSLGVQQRRDSSRLRDLAGAQFVELVVNASAPAAGQAVREVSWPRRTILTSIRRTGELLMPRGDTVLQPGDEVVALTDRSAVAEVRQLIAGANDDEA